MNENCGCCDGIVILTPLPIANRPGLDALLYRVGTHASFLETMMARLSNFSMDILLNQLDTQGNQMIETIYPLQGLTTRSEDDPAIALLDAWATVADVLTFYQERTANEGYLRTAIERRSILELARLVGYALRPGVAASVYLAYTLEKDHDVIILPGNRAQSVPGPGELPQSFETAEQLEARFAWNALKARLTRPQYITLITRGEVKTLQTRTNDGAIYLQGTNTNLKPGDTLLFVFSNDEVFSDVLTVEAQAAESRTKITIAPPPEILRLTRAHLGMMTMSTQGGDGDAFSSSKEPTFTEIVEKLELPPSLQPRNTQRLERSISQAFTRQSDIHPQLLVNFSPILQPTLYSAIANAPFTASAPLLEVQAMRVKAAPFGHNAPLKPILNQNGIVIDHEEWPLGDSVTIDARLTLDGDTPVSAEFTIRQGKNRWSQSVNLNNVTDIDVPSAPATPKVHVTVFISDPDTPNHNSVTFKFLDSGEIIHLTQETTGWGVQVDSDQKQILSSGESQQYSTDQHTIEATFIDGDFNVSDEVFLPLPNPNLLPLDAQYDKIIQTSGGLVSWVVIERPDRNNPDNPTKSEQIITQAQKVETVSIAAYGITGKVTQLTLRDPWLFDKDRSLSILRRTTVYAQSEKRELAEQPLDEEIRDETVQTKRVGTDTIELDGLYDGLKSGQRLIISGERTDVVTAGVNVPGVRASELVMLKSATQEVATVEKDDGTTIDLPGDKKHTFLHLAKPLAYTYKRDTITINVNVVRATHGETRNEVLGSGDGSKALQQFALRQSPLTYLAAPTSAGAVSTLQVRVNDVLWHEVESLAIVGSTDRSYVTETDGSEKTTVIFGNGQHGARLPSGVENVKAVYRTGIGKPGNVRAEQISLLATKPLGVKSVLNPLRASGGADGENRDQARRNVPLALLALDRLVSVQDYQDFARTYAGIGKASAIRLSDSYRQLVHLTIAGADNIPIDTTSDLYLNLFQALLQFGDPNQPLKVDLAEVLFLILSIKVRLLPDYQLESVEPKIRVKLLDRFSFDRRQLGQSVFQSEVLSVIQGTVGVDYVELEVMAALGQEQVLQAFDTLQQQTTPEPEEEGENPDEEKGETPEQEKAEEFLELLGLTDHQDIVVKLARINPNDPKKFLPAQLVFLNPDVPDTLIITELPQ